MSGKYSVMIALFPYGHVIDDRLMTYVVRTTEQMNKDPRIIRHCIWQESDTPITMLRNKCLVEAEEHGYDFVLMLDSDNLPDLYLGCPTMPNVKPFWQSSFDFATDIVARKGVPTVIAAPYCGPGPHACVYVFDWVNFRNPGLQPNGLDVKVDFKLDMVPRHEAALRTGIQPAGALPTGVCLIDMRAVKPLPHPRFDYEWTDQRAIQKASTEDVMFTRNLSYLWEEYGNVLYCNWDAWAGHVKQEIIGKPQNYPNAWVPKHLVAQTREALAAGAEPPVNPQVPKTMVRARNSFPAPPKNFPVSLIGQQVAVPLVPEDDCEEGAPPELLREFESNGVG